MTLQLLLLAAFLVALGMLPWALRWLRGRLALTAKGGGVQSRFVSAVAVGPAQRVVTVEVGPENARVWLTVGVTPQAIELLHTAPAPARVGLSLPEDGLRAS